MFDGVMDIILTLMYISHCKYSNPIYIFPFCLKHFASLKPLEPRPCQRPLISYIRSHAELTTFTIVSLSGCSENLLLKDMKGRI